MAKYAVMPEADYLDACNAVREKTGGTAPIKSGDMGAQIRAIVGAPKKCKVTVESRNTGSGSSDLAFVVIGDTFYRAEVGTDPVVVEVDPGTEIYFNVSGDDKSSDKCWISINDEDVQSGSGAYPYAVTTDMEVFLNVLEDKDDSFYGSIYVTTSETANPVIEALEITKNGTYTAPAGVDGYSPITVNVAETEPVLQEKTVTENGEVTADEGYTGLSKVTVNVPVPDGYIVPSGELEVTENGTHDVTEYASVVVNVETSGGSGGDTTYEDGIINRSISGAYTNDRVTGIGQFAFRGCTKVTSFSFPKAKSVGSNAIYGCTALTSVDLPVCTSIAENAFNGCSKLPSIVLPSLTSGGSYMFRYCYLLLTVDLPVIKNIVANMFADCRRLTAVILRSTTMCTLAATSAFLNCYHFTGTKNSQYNPNGLKDGYMYVPRALLSDDDETKDYRRATNWSTYQFRALEDYTVDGTITGELDWDKVNAA